MNNTIHQFQQALNMQPNWNWTTPELLRILDSLGSGNANQLRSLIKRSGKTLWTRSELVDFFNSIDSFKNNNAIHALKDLDVFPQNAVPIDLSSDRNATTVSRPKALFNALDPMSKQLVFIHDVSEMDQLENSMLAYSIKHCGRETAFVFVKEKINKQDKLLMDRIAVMSCKHIVNRAYFMLPEGQFPSDTSFIILLGAVTNDKGIDDPEYRSIYSAYVTDAVFDVFSDISDRESLCVQIQSVSPLPPCDVSNSVTAFVNLKPDDIATGLRSNSDLAQNSHQ